MKFIKKCFLSIKNSFNIGKKKLIIICLILMFFLSFGVSFGKYAYIEFRDFYFSTKKFYFNSDKLTSHGALYKIENWSGVGEYSIIINLNSYENNNLYGDEDVYYDIDYSCSDTVVCSVVDNKSSGVVLSDKNNDSFTVVISVPTNSHFETNDSVELYVSASSSSPYYKELSATFTLVVGQYGLSYEVDDSVGSPYLDFRITNTLDYYTVDSSFDNYDVGDQLDVDRYLELSDINKEKCHSVIITLTFDPNVVLLDMTSQAYMDAVSVSVVNIDGYDYVQSLSFKMDALASQLIKFYKVDATKDYTYPIINVDSVIDFDYSQKVFYEL